MRTIRRVGGMAFAGLLLTSVVGGQAASAADTTTKTPETYLGSASGTSLHLKVGAQEISAGVSNALADSTLKAVADGAGALNVPVVGGSVPSTKVEVSGDNTKQVAADKCATPDLASIPGVGAQLASVMSVGVGCSSSLAEVNAGLPHALGTGSVFNLDLSLNSALAQSPVTLDTLKPVLDAVYGGLDTLNKQINTVAPGTPDLKLDDTLAELVQALGSTKTLVVKLGNSTSEVTSDGNKVTSVAKSDAGLIQLFPIGAALPTATGITLKPIVEIEIGSSSASATYDRVTGKSDPKFNPAIAIIRVNTPTTDALSGVITGFTPQEITIQPDLTPAGVPLLASIPAAIVKGCSDAPNEFCILEGTPLETRVAVASGRTVQNADGSVGAIADAVKVHALRRITETPVVGAQLTALQGGILLELAHAQAGVGGKPAELVTVSVPDIPRELPRTGGTPWIPMAAVAGVVIALAARRTMVKASAR